MRLAPRDDFEGEREQRIELASNLRSQSGEANSNKAEDIMDVTYDEVTAVMAEYDVRTLIHGHTHRPASIPASAAFPYAQMIGGGPRPEQATWTVVTAGADGMTITIRRLATGDVIHQEHFARLS